MLTKKSLAWLIAALLLLFPLIPHPAAAEPPYEILQKIEGQVLDELAAEGETDIFIWMVEKADLGPAYSLSTKEEKGRFVYNALRETAERTQKELCAQLDQMGVDYRPFYIANKVLVRHADQAVLYRIAVRRDVSHITANHRIQLSEPMPAKPSATAAASGIESNLSYIHADSVWAMGITGQGTVLAGNDTGLDATHPALAPHYRGCLNPPDCSSWDHNYNWWDATGTYTTAPGDGYGHGIHTTGIMVGDDGGDNQTGIAPGALTIHCKNMLDHSPWGDVATHSECFEWDLAPWNLSYTGPGTGNPRPDLAPDVINNSWGEGGGDYPNFKDEIAALQAAGILVEASAGNSGPSCQSLNSPADYREVLTTGSISHATAPFPGILADYSSRGPSDLDPGYFPDVVAPGAVRSTYRNHSYAVWQGTSQAGPHVSGLVGLLWSACPDLRGQITETTTIITSTAVPLTGQTGLSCGGDYNTGPNHDWGYGTIDALAAVNQALQYCSSAGTLIGTVTDASTEMPISDASVQATLSPSQTRQTTSNAQGAFSMLVLSGTYQVQTERYGYHTRVLADVAVASHATTTLDIELTPVTHYTVSGRVSDALTKLPLYAQIDIENYPGPALWTQPETGWYSVTLASGITHTFQVQAWDPAYSATQLLIAPLTSDLQQDFALELDPTLGCPPGYHDPFIFYDGFETGSLAPHWSITTTEEGRVQVSQTDPYEGDYSVLLDDYVNANPASIAGIVLTQDLSAESQVFLDFWWHEYGDENHTQDGVFISDDQGVNWCRIFSFNDGPAAFQHNTVDLTAALPGCAISYTTDFQIKFQFYDNASIPGDGYTIDAVRLARAEDDQCAPIHIYLPIVHK